MQSGSARTTLRKWCDTDRRSKHGSWDGEPGICRGLTPRNAARSKSQDMRYSRRYERRQLLEDLVRACAPAELEPIVVEPIVMPILPTPELNTKDETTTPTRRDETRSSEYDWEVRQRVELAFTFAAEDAGICAGGWCDVELALGIAADSPVAYEWWVGDSASIRNRP